MVKKCEAKATLKILTKVCESEMYVKEKEKKKCELFLMYVITLMKIKLSIIQIGHIFQIIHTEY